METHGTPALRPGAPAAASRRLNNAFDQGLFLEAWQALDGALTLHGGGAVGLRLDVYEPDRQSHAGIAGAAARIVDLDAAHRVSRPAGVEGAVGALDDVAIARRGRLWIRLNTVGVSRRPGA